MMRKEVTSVDDRVSQSFVRIIYADLCAYTPSDAFIRPCFHLGEVLEIVLDTIVAVF